MCINKQIYIIILYKENFVISNDTHGVISKRLYRTQELWGSSCFMPLARIEHAINYKLRLKTFSQASCCTCSVWTQSGTSSIVLLLAATPSGWRPSPWYHGSQLRGKSNWSRISAYSPAQSVDSCKTLQWATNSHQCTWSLDAVTLFCGMHHCCTMIKTLWIIEIDWCKPKP